MSNAGLKLTIQGALPTELPFLGCKLKVGKYCGGRESVGYNFFFSRNWSSNDASTWRHFACSLKNKDVGYCEKASSLHNTLRTILNNYDVGKKKESLGVTSLHNTRTIRNVFNIILWRLLNFLEWVRVDCWLKAREDKERPILFYFPPLHFQPTTNSPSIWKASCSNPCSYFSSCMQNDVISVHHCWTSFRKKSNCIILSRWRWLG